MATAMARGVGAEVAPLQGTPPQEVDLLEQVAACAQDFETTIGRDFRERCNKFYRQYRGYRKFADAWVAAGPNDRDAVVYDAKVHWGAHLHIPMSFRTIETMVPRAIAHRPKMLYFPRNPDSGENVHGVRMMIDAQQQNISIDLPFQAQMRSGRMYGIGIGKSRWRKDWAWSRGVSRSRFGSNYVVGDKQQKLIFDDPDYEDVDVFDFMWDPYGSDIETCEWVAHRAWLSTKGCVDRLQSGAWNTESAKLLDPEKIQMLGPGRNRYDEVWAERMEASGFNSLGRGSQAGEQPHELIEWHDGERVLAILDRQVLVVQGENACTGHKPFTAYRPTPLQRQMVGIGDLEMMHDLNRELDTLRSQRRDSATLALAVGFAYDEGSVDIDDLVFGPRAAIPVSNANPANVLMPLRTQDVPGTAYQEEQVIKGDIDAVTGMADEANGQVQGGTATESMLVQASLSLRIQLSSRRFELEAVTPAARQFLYLDQRMILEKRQIRQPEQGVATADASATGRWEWFEISPEDLQGEFDIVPEGGSMAQRNIAQDRQDAQAFMQMAQNPLLDSRKPLLKGLELMGVSDPEAWLKRAAQPVPPEVFDALKRAGVDPGLIDMTIRWAQSQDPQLAPERGPNTDEVGQMMGAEQ